MEVVNQNLSISINTMSTVTCTVAKRIPPRLRSPKQKQKGSVKKMHNEKVAKNLKRKVATDSNEELSESGESSDLPREKRKKENKRQWTISLSSDEEVEVVNNASKPLPVVEEVDDMPEVEPVQSDDSDPVSTNPQRLKNLTHNMVVGK